MMNDPRDTKKGFRKVYPNLYIKWTNMRNICKRSKTHKRDAMLNGIAIDYGKANSVLFCDDICLEWAEFENYASWVLSNLPYTENAVVNRIDVSKPYEPGNLQCVSKAAHMTRVSKHTVLHNKYSKWGELK